MEVSGYEKAGLGVFAEEPLEGEEEPWASSNLEPRLQRAQETGEAKGPRGKPARSWSPYCR